ncbi:MAG: tRNA adenosine(34) deaminase TadA [Psychrobium sp.]
MNLPLTSDELSQLSVEDCDQYWMSYALALADKAQQVNEVPVGAVLVLDNQVIGEGYNLVINNNDPCAHAEVMALRTGGEKIENYRLLDATLYVTLEPCCMCSGAIVHSRIKRVVYGADDLKTGAAGSAFALINDAKHNHQVEVTSGVMASECGTIISDFFSRRRAEKKALKAKNKKNS